MGYCKVNTNKNIVYIDLEIYFDQCKDIHRVVEAAVVHHDGTTLLNELVKPCKDNYLPFESNVQYKQHVGISNEDLIKAKRTFPEIKRSIEEIARCNVVYSWNKEHEMKYLLDNEKEVYKFHCAMKRFANYYNQYDSYWGSCTYKKLSFAADYFELEWIGEHHRSLPDAKMLRDINIKLDEIGIRKPIKNNIHNASNSNKQISHTSLGNGHG